MVLATHVAVYGGGTISYEVGILTHVTWFRFLNLLEWVLLGKLPEGNALGYIVRGTIWVDGAPDLCECRLSFRHD